VTTLGVILLVSAVVNSILLYLTLRWQLRDLLLESVKIPAAAQFYLRVLLSVLLLAAVSSTIKESVSSESGFMDQVWSITGTLQGYMIFVVVVLLIYTFMITILLAHLRRRNDQ
jgi:peptidoglycan biosynthesis protein MviN/MurJ (putative lipid II flippase)